VEYVKEFRQRPPPQLPEGLPPLDEEPFNDNTPPQIPPRRLNN